MSYLDVPRIHFGGLFFTNPNTINNYDGSYNPSVPLTNPQGGYISNPPQGQPSGWNPLGVAQLYLSECTVLSAVGPGGTAVSGDPIVGALVESPSPSTPKPMPDGQGDYDIAKMVDLDPDQQGRSAVYGLRIYVTLPDGSGFSGLMSVPELQETNLRVAPPPSPRGSWFFVGTWMGQITDVTWNAGTSSSFLTQFQEACGLGIDVKLTVDLHQNDPNSSNAPGNMFYYGRVLGSLGPVKPGELAQVVPGRQIATPPAPSPQDLAVTVQQKAGSHDTQAVEAAASGLGAALAPSLTWNMAPAQVSQETDGSSLLHVDLGGSLQLQAVKDANGLFSSNGQFLQDTGISIGVVTGSGGFQPLANGQGISFANQYVPLNSPNKQVSLVTSSGLVDVALEPSEVSLVSQSPLAITVNGTLVLQEPADGLLIGSQPFSVRLTPGGSAIIQVMARQFGLPVTGQEPLTTQVSVVIDENGDTAPSSNVAITWNSPTDSNGLGTLTVSTVSQDPVLPAYRDPMDSQVYFVSFTDLSGQPIGDGNANVSALRFQGYTAPAAPTWQQDVGPVLQAYARLYPGMKNIFDIGNEALVSKFAPRLLARMDLALFLDPVYMPVTRDLSPEKVAMILAWLKTQVPPQT